MKDERFIELVNLYIDRQISAAETADLEAEMQADPRRRAIYRQYCQMHRATTLVYDSFRAGAPEQQRDVAKGRATIARFENQQRHRRTGWTYYAGGLAAACLALVLVRLNSNHAAAPTLVQTAAVQPVTVAVVAAQPPATAKSRGTVAGSPGSLRNSSLPVQQDYAAMLAALRLEEQHAFANGQIISGRGPSLFEDGVFEAQQVMPANSQRVFRSKQAPAQQAEFTAFQFQR
jgi:hypothetical protein